MRVPLNKPGLFAVVDDEDYDKVIAHHWSIFTDRTGIQYAYTQLKIGGTWRKVRLHRFILDPPRTVLIDHKDRNGLNCTRQNIRPATHTQNMQNARKKACSRLPYRGIHKAAFGTRWQARIRGDGKRHHLGTFETAEEAARAYDAAARHYHGEFASLNFPEGCQS